MNWEEFISLKNIYQSWKDFSRDKQNKGEVISFKMNLEAEILQLRFELANDFYEHGSYKTFKVFDPKERIIHKASLRDRVVHHLVYNYLLPIFHRQWLDCSFSCRPGFGQHLSIEKVKKALKQAASNYSRECFAVKCDIKKFFDHINHNILYQLIIREVYEPNMRKLIKKIIESFSSSAKDVGVPIGNLTSQIFANIYLHELDLFAKHDLKMRRYYRYADDFIFLTDAEKSAEEAVLKIRNFLNNSLKLELHPKKIIIRRASWGIDWLGKVLLPDYVLLRPATRRRMMGKIKKKIRDGVSAGRLVGVVASYNGLLRGTARRKINEEILQAAAFYR